MPDPNIIGGRRTKTLDELMAEQGIEPVTVQELAMICASWPEDHDPEKMLAFILTNRRRYDCSPVHGGRRMIWTAAIVLGSMVIAAFIAAWLVFLKG